jgi:hypothetical protein
MTLARSAPSFVTAPSGAGRGAELHAPMVRAFLISPLNFCPSSKSQSLNEIAMDSRLHGSINIIVLKGRPHNQEPTENGIRETLRLVWG